MEVTKDIMAYIWMLGFAASATLTIIGILRWLADRSARKRRLNIVSGCAFCIFLWMIWSTGWIEAPGIFQMWFGSSTSATKALIETSKITIKVLLLVLIVAFAVMLTLIAALFVIYGVWAIIRTFFSSNNAEEEPLKDVLQKKAEKFVIMLSNPVFIVIITGGILAVFGIIPIVMGSGSGSLAKCWVTGVENIAFFCGKGQNFVRPEALEPFESIGDSEALGHSKFGQALSIYLLVYISVLGIGYAVANILFEIIKELFNRKNKKGFLSEYSNSIVLLAVGVSILLMFSIGEGDEDPTWTYWLGNFSKSFALVLFVIAMGVLTLEIVRLLMDMKETLIRREARYLFVMLVGQCTVISVKALSLIYNALSSALAGNGIASERAEEHIGNVQEQILDQIAQDTNQEINEVGRNTDNTKLPYAVFKKRVTRK